MQRVQNGWIHHVETFDGNGLAHDWNTRASGASKPALVQSNWKHAPLKLTEGVVHGQWSGVMDKSQARNLGYGQTAQVVGDHAAAGN